MVQRANQTYVDIEDTKILYTTDKAIRFEWNGESYWLPRSQIGNMEELLPLEGEDTLVTIEATEWIAKKGGFI